MGGVRIGTSATLNTFQVESVKRASGTNYVWLNSASYGSTACSGSFNSDLIFGTHGFYYGPSSLRGYEYYGDVDIAEFIIYYRALSDSERATVLSYLQTKYALSF